MYPSSSTTSVYSSIPHSQSNPIDLTLDDDDDDPCLTERMYKRTCPSSRSFNANCPSPTYHPMSRPPYHSGLSPAMSSSSLQTEQPPVYPPQHHQQFYGQIPQPQYSTNVAPPFLGPSSPSAFNLAHSNHSPPRHTPVSQPHTPTYAPQPQHWPAQSHQQTSNVQARQVIDLTNSPSPPPAHFGLPTSLPPDLPPRAPVCIGQLMVTALVLYPVEYIKYRPPPPKQADLSFAASGYYDMQMSVDTHIPSQANPSYLENDGNNFNTPVDKERLSSSDDPEWDWVPVKFHFDPSPPKPGTQQTINLKSLPCVAPDGSTCPPENFAVVESKAAMHLCPLLAKGLIRFDGKVRRMPPSNQAVPILPLQLLVYTPKGNIPAVGGYLEAHNLLLDHPHFCSDIKRLSTHYYHNPHNPPPGGHNRNPLGPGPMCGPGMGPRWGGPAGSKSIEVQRSQVDAVFKSLEEGDELPAASPPKDVVTKLYPHQLKAITFLLEREHERLLGLDNKPPSLWQDRDIDGRKSWFHVVTQREVFEQPIYPKGSILADDMGLGKTITCVALMAHTMDSALEYTARPLVALQPPPKPVTEGQFAPPGFPALTPDDFRGAVWGVTEQQYNQHPQQTYGHYAPSMSAKAKAKATREYEKAEAEYTRNCRIKARSRGTLIICPLSTVANWEDQFREHWKGEVTVVGGASGVSCAQAAQNSSAAPNSAGQAPASGSGTGSSQMGASGTQGPAEVKSEEKETKVDVKPPSTSVRVRTGRPLRVYVYHGNARRPDPAFLADFDAVITTYSTLATEYSKQTKSIEEDVDTANGGGNGGSSDDCVETDERGVQLVIKMQKSKRSGVKKRKKTCQNVNGIIPGEATSPLQSVDWFRVVLDEAHYIKETSTVACRACCDLVADRRLCLTGTPVQNKLDDVYALLKFLRMAPFDDKATWTEFIGTPVKYGQPLGTARLKTIMGCITLRRTKNSKDEYGERILTLPKREDNIRYLKFSPEEQAMYDEYFNESKAEFSELSSKNEVMKNYVGILQKILRLRQICDHRQLVLEKGMGVIPSSYEELASAIAREGINPARANAIFSLLREAGTAQCVECSFELGVPPDAAQDGWNGETDLASGAGPKKNRKPKPSTSSRNSTRQNSPTACPIVLTKCQHLFCIQCFRGSSFPGWPSVPPDQRRACSVCQTHLSPCDAVEVVPECPLAELSISGGKKKNGRREKKKEPGSTAYYSSKINALIQDLVPLSRMNPDSENWYVKKAREEGQVISEDQIVREPIVKSVVFSQWTSMLDKVEDALDEHKIKYDRLDGTMKRDERTRAMDALKFDPKCEVLLVSLKAGGVGLNLTAAQRVYLLDPYWNPAVENQAIDRIHRLGQTRDVQTFKFIISDSIEARLLEVQRKKTELANMTIDNQHSKADSLKMRMAELNQLFAISG